MTQYTGKIKSRLKELVARREHELGRRITQKEIGEETNLNPHTISAWMSPEPLTRIDEKSLIPLCGWLGCEIGDLLYIDTREEL